MDPQELKQAIARTMPLLTAADFCDRNAREIGAQEALVDRRRRLTWSNVKQLSDRLALRLLGLGLRRDAKVLVQLPNVAELFLTRLACEKAGLRLVTVTPNFRRAELSPIVRFTKPEVAIIPQEYRGFNYPELLGSIRTPGLRYLLVEGENVPPGALSMEDMLSPSPGLEDNSDRLRKTRYSILDVCQIATTSGSTGTPKCVEVPLYTRLLTGWIHLRRFGVGHNDKLAAVTPIVTGTADALVYNGACQAGARVVLIDHFAPDETCAIMEAEKVTVIPLVPTMIARLMAFLSLSRCDLGALRVLISHGSHLPHAQGVEFEKLLGCRIVQGYGSVDCGGISATSWGDPPEVRLGTVGRPLDGNEIKIVDARGREVQPREVGRLLVRGLHTEARFFNNPKLDASRRRDSYFDLQELARLDGRGNVILMGREQDLIIRGGRNIFPADIEEPLSQHPKVQEVSVIGVPDPEMGERVCAYVVCNKGQPLNLSEVTSFLEEKGLARFKWPERLRIVDSLPRVASGHKIDKRKLERELKESLSFEQMPADRTHNEEN
ncbi:MAG: AMP-binding protein [Candidatus Binatia bacterium]